MTPLPAGWKPIESAPKDGTPVLLFARHVDAEASTRVVGWFNADYGWIAQSYIGQPVARLIPSQWAELLPFPGSPASVAPGDAQDERQAFEAWSKRANQGYDLTPNVSGRMATYESNTTEHAYRGFFHGMNAPAAPAAGDARDAERYRWLCDKFGVTKLPCAIERIIEGKYVADGKESIDAAIDAAIAASQQGGE